MRVLRFTQRRQSDGGMRICPTRAHFGRDPHRLHQLLGSGPLAERRLGMAADAIRTLRHVCHGDGNDLFDLGGQCAVGEDLAAERLKRPFRSRAPAPASFPRSRTRRGIDEVGQGRIRKCRGIIPRDDCGRESDREIRRRPLASAPGTYCRRAAEKPTQGVLPHWHARRIAARTT